MRCAALKEESLQPEVTGITAKATCKTCSSPRGRKQATHRCCDSLTTDLLVRHHLLFPNLLFFSRSCFGQSSTYSVIRHLFLYNRSCYSHLPKEAEPPQAPSPDVGEALGYRIGKCWEEQLEVASGRDPPPFHPAFTHTHSRGTSRAPPEAQH